MTRRIVTEVGVDTASRILNLPCDAVNDLCAEGKLRARRASKTAPWKIDYDSLIDYHHAHPGAPKAARKGK